MSQAPEPADPLIGVTVGNYAITAKLGAGGMGAVYLALHPGIGRKVAVKVLLPEHSKRQDLTTRFFNEAKAAATLRHPALVDVFDFGFLPDGAGYLVMDFLEGESLAGRLTRLAPLPPASAAEIGRQLAAGVAAAHAQGIVHRDLKPDNIFLVPDPELPTGERVKILDFGIAKLLAPGGLGSKGATSTGMLIGTPLYMAPEQCRGTGQVDHRADIYSAGCILYETLAGRPPFDYQGVGEILAAHLYQAPRPLLEHDASIPVGLAATIMRALEKDPGARQQTMSELAAELLQFLRECGVQGAYGSPGMSTSGALAQVRPPSQARPSAAGAAQVSDPGGAAALATGATALATGATALASGAAPAASVAASASRNAGPVASAARAGALATAPTTFSAAAAQASPAPPAVAAPAARSRAPLALVAVAAAGVALAAGFFLLRARTQPGPAAAGPGTSSAGPTSAAPSGNPPAVAPSNPPSNPPTPAPSSGAPSAAAPANPTAGPPAGNPPALAPLQGWPTLAPAEPAAPSAAAEPPPSAPAVPELPALPPPSADPAPGADPASAGGAAAASEPPLPPAAGQLDPPARKPASPPAARAPSRGQGIYKQAGAMRRSGQQDQALLTYRAALRAGGLSAAERADAETQVIYLGRQFGEIEILGAAGARVVLDGRARGYTPLQEPLLVRPGKHTVSLELPGYQPSTRTVVVMAGKKELISLKPVR